MHRIQVDVLPEAAVVDAAGELDAYAEPDISEHLSRAAQRGRVVVDLDAVSFLDSTALGTIVRFVRDLMEGGAHVRVVLPRGSARRIFEITALDGALPIAASRAEALAEIGG